MLRKYIIVFIILLINSILSFSQTQLTIRGYSEGFYRPSAGHMVAVADPINHPTICDTAKIVLLNDTSQIVEFCTDIIIDTSGEGNYLIPSGYSGKSFIIGLRFRNTLHLFSSSAILMNGIAVNVDLTDPQNCCTQTKVVQGVAVAMSGEISSSISGIGFYDGIIEGQDFGDMENAVYLQESGYVISDLTGDGITDSADYLLVLENVNFTGMDCYYAICNSSNAIDDFLPNNFNMFPNPVTDNINITFIAPLSSLKIKLFNAIGQQIIESNYFNSKEIIIPCNNLQSGLYHLTIENEGKHFTKKIMVCK